MSTIQLLQPFAGRSPGIYDLGTTENARLIGLGLARAAGLSGVEARSGVSALSGEWRSVPSIFRLRLTGTGTVTVDSRDALLTERLALATYVVSAATNEIKFPFLGPAATQLRVTLTGTATAEVI